ncbi:MAG: hypothetical protein NVSMB34_04170 [Variovorax sp.]
MKTSQIIAAALSILAAAGAQAETYDGVHALTNQRSRAEVGAEAVVAARSGNPYGESGTSVATPAQGSTLARSTVLAEAYATAHAPNQNLDRKAFVNSVIPSQYANASLSNRTVQAGE